MITNIFTVITEMLSFTFLVRALIVGALVSVCAALLGVSLVLKRYSMIGDGLSHVGFGALAVATALNAAPLLVAIPLVIAAAFLLLRLGEKHLLKGDAAIALISTSSLAAGVVIISRTTGMNTDVCNYLFGSILAMNKTDVYLSIGLSIIVLALFVLFYHKLFAITFDETFAKTAGVKTGLYNMLIALLTALIIVLGMRMMGAMLISALIIFPALTSMRVFKKFKSVSVCSVCVSVFCFFTGVVISYIYAIPTGASVVLVNICGFIIFWLINTMRKEKLFMKKSIRVVQQFQFLNNFHLKIIIFLIIFPLIVSCGNTARKNSGTPAFGQGEFTSTSKNAAGTSAVTLSADSVKVEDAQGLRIIMETTAPTQSGNIIEIKEKMFLAQTNDVYLNPEDYLGKTIKLEGLFKREQYGGADYCFVLRYGPGCCGSDGNAGFEVAWNKAAPAEKTWPAADEWVEAAGVLKTYEQDGYPYLYLDLVSLALMDKRGAEFVTQ
jgi:zinc transport system permease protein